MRFRVRTVEADRNARQSRGETTTKTGLAAIALAIVAFSTVGCEAQARSPEPVPLDRVECARCRMLISSDRGGGEIVSSSADTRFYDDIACLAADWALRLRSGQALRLRPAQSRSPDDAHAFVRLSDGRWIDAHAASYAQPNGARTAMGSDFVAYASIAEARAVDRAGRALTFDEVAGLTGGAR